MAILVALPAGAAVLALWLIARRPSLLPDTLRGALLHFVVALVLVEFAPRAGAPLAAEGQFTSLVAVVLVLAALVYAWLAVAAVLRNFNDLVAD
jgi:hypothetical protein